MFPGTGAALGSRLSVLEPADVIPHPSRDPAFDSHNSNADAATRIRTITSQHSLAPHGAGPVRINERLSRACPFCKSSVYKIAQRFPSALAAIRLCQYENR